MLRNPEKSISYLLLLPLALFLGGGQIFAEPRTSLSAIPTWNGPVLSQSLYLAARKKKKKKKIAEISPSGEFLGLLSGTLIVSEIPVTKAKPKSKNGARVSCSAGATLQVALLVTPTSQRKAAVTFPSGSVFGAKRTSKGFVVRPPKNSGLMIGSGAQIKEKVTVTLKNSTVAGVTVVGKQSFGTAGSCTYVAKGSVLRQALGS